MGGFFLGVSMTGCDRRKPKVVEKGCSLGWEKKKHGGVGKWGKIEKIVQKEMETVAEKKLKGGWNDRGYQTLKRDWGNKGKGGGRMVTKKTRKGEKRDQDYVGVWGTKMVGDGKAAQRRGGGGKKKK